MDIHIGNEIRRQWETSGTSASEFARQIGHARQNLQAILGRDTMDTGLLFNISSVLGHDFFAHYSAQLPFRADAPAPDAAAASDLASQLELVRLRAELAAAHKEIGYLKEIIDLLKGK